MSLPSASHSEAVDGKDEVQREGPSKTRLRVLPLQRVAPTQVAPMLPVGAAAQVLGQVKASAAEDVPFGGQKWVLRKYV